MGPWIGQNEVLKAGSALKNQEYERRKQIEALEEAEKGHRVGPSRRLVSWRWQKEVQQEVEKGLEEAECATDVTD